MLMVNFLIMMNKIIRKIKKNNVIIAIVQVQYIANLFKKKSQKFFNKIKNLIHERHHSKTC